MKQYWLVLVVVAMLALTACGSSNSTASNKKAFIGGTVGVLTSFMPDEPPTEVTSSDYPFSVTVKLENKGEWEVPKDNVFITLKGIDAGDFGISVADMKDQHPDSDLTKNELNPDTGEIVESTPAYKTFKLQYSKPITGNHEFPIVVDSCYEYGTLATGDVCVKEKPLDTTDTSVCTITGPKNLQNSGGPVQVTQFQEYTSGTDAVRFTIMIGKTGAGDVSKKGSTCSTDAGDKDYVHMKINTDLQGDLSCAGLNDGTEADIKLIDGLKQITCTQKLTGDDKTDKVKLANIELTYDYLDTIQTTVLVKQVSQ